MLLGLRRAARSLGQRREWGGRFGYSAGSLCSLPRGLLKIRSGVISTAARRSAAITQSYSATGPSAGRPR
jgi:hypothetical protein